ncbi:MAG: class I SAM-dependent methyltransferase [Cytophagales bacterium]
MKNYYSRKNSNYFNTSGRIDLVDFLPKKGKLKILEIGASGGDTLLYLKNNNFADEVWGVDLFAQENSNQSNRAIDNFFIGDIEKMDLELFFEKEYFDVILLPDVLEHLLDPWTMVEKINAYLKIDGVIISSIPNIREFKTLFNLVFKADFKYDESGVLDKTHLRFFCRKNIITLLTLQNLQVVNVCPSFEKHPLLRRKKILNGLTFGLFKDFLAQQYIVVSLKTK